MTDDIFEVLEEFGETLRRSQQTLPIEPTNPLADLIHKPHQRGGVQDLGKIWRIHQFGDSGIVLLAAERGTGKTTVMNLAMESVQEGTPFLAAFRTTQANALLIQGDEPERTSERKFRRQGLKRRFDVIYPDGAFPLEQLFQVIDSQQYGVIGIDSLTTVLCAEGQRTTDNEIVDVLYRLNKASVNKNVLLVTTAHLNKAPKDGHGVRRKRIEIQWDDISGLGTISAAVQDCWGLTSLAEGQFSLHALGKRNIEPGTKWILERDSETFNWWLADQQDQQKPAEAEALAKRVRKHVEQHGYQSIRELVTALGGNAEYLRLVCFDQFEQGHLQRHQRSTGKRGRPEYLYGVGDFSHVRTPPSGLG